MEIIKISTSDYIKTTTAEIDGHIYKVRRMGAGDTLDISQAGIELDKLRPLVQEAEKKFKDGKDDKDLAKLTELVEKVAKLSDQLLEAYARLFDDGEGGKKSKELVKKVGTENIQKLLDAIFGEVDG